MSTSCGPRFQTTVSPGIPIPGPVGPQGNPGIQGPPGQAGANGGGLLVKGTVPTAGDLPPGGSPGDGWIAVDTGHLWTWNGSGWIDAGPFGGPPGPQGSPGPTGPTGPEGAGLVVRGTVPTAANLPAQGSPGDGWIALDTGHIWTWSGIAWIDGGPFGGPPGAAGAPGATGPPGAAGTPGTAGSPGAAGPAGPAGPTGPTGFPGPTGLTGPTGAPGATGPPGPAGYSGPTNYTALTGRAINTNYQNTRAITVWEFVEMSLNAGGGNAQAVIGSTAPNTPVTFFAAAVGPCMTECDHRYLGVPSPCGLVDVNQHGRLGRDLGPMARVFLKWSART